VLKTIKLSYLASKFDNNIGRILCLTR